ncbi:HECT-domain (ubiquitin-transferase) domain-containing protein [Trichoderma breve]|uniref:HECT-type E3 ubiquitin transferase n=1 Tax=Trichoderma breve TaxID=2034170 RepID=A0A9W9B8P1_9HYPO|nr:HECT-domain (ubiquitin-transferase) domain-containing protein [Trichoderma breve]KAJ4855478.1 HECT-domain (ubiquitin-transferase) domain-containing protein [Trichoderma breve]
MSPRITRSSARQAASQAARAPAASSESSAPTAPPPPPSSSSSSSRKRKVSSAEKNLATGPQPSSSVRRSKRQKIPEAAVPPPPPETVPNSSHSSLPRKGRAAADMDGADSNTGSRRSARSKRTSNQSQATVTSMPASRDSQLFTGNASDQDAIMTGMGDDKDHFSSSSPHREDAQSSKIGKGDGHGEDDDLSRDGGTTSIEHASFNDDDEDEEDEEEDEDEHENDHDNENEDEDDDDDDDEDDDENEDDPFGAYGGPGDHDSGLSSTLRALTGMMTGLSSRLRELLASLRSEDSSVQVIALQELSEIFLVSNEDNLSGHFSPDAFVKELVQLMSKEESPEIMLLACRCLANLMEALPASIANVVYGNAVPVLCQKLLEISFIDLAEQALSTLEKISTEYPSSIVREGGLTACLSYLDFFATSTQRTAVTTAANCCRNIPDDSFPVVKDVMPTLLNVLNSNDQRVVEQASLCVSGIAESFKYHPSKLEELISVDLLRAILRLLVPGTTNLIGPNIHTQFLRVLAFTARASPRLSSELFKLNVVETLYQILTGVSPPTGTEDVASKLDSVIVMQALIHRPREQIVEALNVICELLPGLPRNAGVAVGDFMELHDAIEPITPSSLSGRSNSNHNDRRLELLEDCKDQVRRFVLIIFPTLTDAFSSTINLSVRQKVLTAQIKMLSNLDEGLLAEALAPVPYASFLASILSQEDHPSLVILGLQATELLLTRLDSVYRYQLYREGVIFEIQKLALDDGQPSIKEDPSKLKNGPRRLSLPDAGDSSAPSSDHESDDNDNEDEEAEDEGAAHEHHSSGGDDEDVDNELNASDASPASSRGSSMSLDAASLPYVSNVQLMKSRIVVIAKKFLEAHEKDGRSQDMRTQATQILETLSHLADELEAFYLTRTSKTLSPETGRMLFTKLSSYFDSDILESITSAELLASGMASFLEVFMSPPTKSRPRTGVTESQATPFSVLIHKLQDLLSRSEHFEVITVHQNSFEGNRSSPASMLGKQLKLRLVADDELSIPRPYRNIMVSIHAIATFKSLDDYLRPRISLAERPRISRRDGLSRALAAIASSGLSQNLTAGAGLTEQPPALPGTTQQPPLPPTSSASSGSRFSGNINRSLRRSSRLFRSPADVPTPPTRPPDEDKAPQPTLECADEKQLTDDEDDDAGDSTALDAIVGELDEDIGEKGEADTSAVNLEVAAENTILTQKEDNSRVATPPGANLHGYDRVLYRNSAHAAPHSSSRHTSYASILQTIPQDWHIEFTLDGKIIPNETTIYRAVHMSTSSANDHGNKNIWSSTHPIKFRRVSGQPPAESRTTSFNAEVDGEIDKGMAASLAKHPITASILQLLNILHDLNANIEDVLFVNTKLTAKLNRQLEEPLIVASSCLPSWSEDLARLYPFLFPFETRHLFLQSTSFGYARSMARWQNAHSTDDNRRDRSNERPFLGRLQRQKVRISRLKILESALKVMELYGASQSILEVEYFEEVGTGLGPTLEFYSTVSKEFSKKKLKLWREVDSAGSDEFVTGQTGLFPRPLSAEEATTPNGERILHMFKALGKFVARSMIDSRIIDIHLNPIFFRIGDASLTGVKPSLGAVKIVDPGLARSLITIKKFVLAKKEIDEDPARTPAQKVADTEGIMIDNMRLEDLCLDFTLPGYPDIELQEHGSLKRVTIENVDLYLEKVIDMTLGSGVKRQIDAFRTGFSQVFPYTALRAFTPDELVSLFGRVEEDWSLETLMDSIKADHGYNMDSRSVKNLLQTMSELDLKQRRDFLQFTTGSPKLPIGGFKSLTPMFTVVCKPSEPPYTSDAYLPSVMTCVNYLKLPDYTTMDILKKQLYTAIREGQGAFHLS